MSESIISFIKNELSSLLTQFAHNNNFSGDVSIYQADSELYHQAFGYRDIPNKIPNQTDTIFGMASGTKLFTALGILKLVAAEQLSLDTKASTLFDDKLSFIDDAATIRQLLCHQSGIFDYYDEDVITDFDNFKVAIPWSELETPFDYWPLFVNQKPKFSAGEDTSYSNGGFVFLGMIIEKVSGQNYRTFINEQVLKPAGMQNSGFFAFNALPPNTANGYLETDDGYKTNIYQLPIRGSGDGGMYTNSHDMQQFWQALFNNQIVAEDYVQILCIKQTQLWNSIDYGLGIYITSSFGKKSFFITGSDGGVGFSSRFIPEMGVNINVLSNKMDGNVAVIKYILEKMESITL
ncbi:MAG: beta-lactamase family protein [Chloroflexi bacterium]|nr:beta-lactamase family protein [Chloroflexota bacterium]